jgi:hypothetical protein
LLCACAAKTTVPRTEVLLQVDAGEKVRAMADTLLVEIASGPRGAQKLSADTPELFDVTLAGFRWPASIALIAKEGHTDHVFEATITAKVKGKSIALARVRSAFLKERTLWLKATLADSCIGYMSCTKDETCADDQGSARCVASLIDPKTLPAFTPHPPRDAGGPATLVGSRDAGKDAGKPSKDAAAADAATDAGRKDAGSARDAGARVDAGGASDAGAAHDAATCQATGPEDCWNGADDDCNGQVDCADSACASPAMCAPAGTMVGVLVADSATCPSGFDESAINLNQGLSDPGCTGCTCTVNAATQCSADVYYYGTTASATTACNADVAPYSGGVKVGTATYTCTSGPIGQSASMDTPYAWRVAPMNVVSGTCTSHGTSSPVPLAWGTSVKLCTTTLAGAGCNKGFVCVPTAGSARACGEKGVTSCPSGSVNETWYTSYNDARSCDSCGCSVSGASCDSVQVKMGHDWSCGSMDDLLSGGEKSCSVGTYAPPVILVGTPTDASCEGSAASRGSMAPTGPIELCCKP